MYNNAQLSYSAWHLKLLNYSTTLAQQHLVNIKFVNYALTYINLAPFAAKMQ